MNLIDASLLIISGLFGVYALAAAVEYGIVLKMLANDKVARRMFTPLWEITNVFLVFGFTGLAILFNGALSSISHQLLVLLAIAIVSLLLRASIVLSVFYVRSDGVAPAWLVWLFSALTMLIPLIFAAAGVYFLTGQMFWQSLLGVVLLITSLAGLSAVGLNIVNRHLSAGRQHLMTQLSAVVWLMLLGSVLPIVVLHSANNLSLTGLLILALSAGSALGLMLLDFLRISLIKSWQALSLLCVAAPSILAWSDRPYLISGHLRLTMAYGAASYGSAMVIGLAIMAPLILGGLYVFIGLLGSPVAAPKDAS